MPERKLALVTGASSGLGIALAEQLALRGYDLVLTARSRAPMDDLARKLTAAHGIEAAVEVADLSRPEGTSELIASLDRLALNPTVLINNAGFGINELFVDHDPRRLTAMLQLNVLSLTELAREYGRRMQAAGRGHMLLVASMAAYQPDPMLAAYGASKAYVLSLGEALHVELAPDIGVTVLSPGFMDTGFSDASGFMPNETARRTMLSTSEVAAIGLKALFEKRPSVVAGAANRAMSVAARLLPRMFVARQVYRAAGRSAART